MNTPLDVRALTGASQERVEDGLRKQFPGMSVFTWIEQGDEQSVTMKAVPAYQVYAFLNEVAESVCWLIDRQAVVKLKPDRLKLNEVLVIIRSFETGAFIGWHGQTLDAVELLLNAIVTQRIGLKLDITVDIDQYRKKRMSFLDALIKRTINEIERDHKERPLVDLLSKERKYVHTALSDHPYLTTESRGKGSRRTLYIVPRKDLQA